MLAGVQVLAATNRPRAVDAALMRPGRLDTLLFVPPPDQQGRLQALRIHSQAMPLHSDVLLEVPNLSAHKTPLTPAYHICDCSLGGASCIYVTSCISNFDEISCMSHIALAIDANPTNCQRDSWSKFGLPLCAVVKVLNSSWTGLASTIDRKHCVSHRLHRLPGDVTIQYYWEEPTHPCIMAAGLSST